MRTSYLNFSPIRLSSAWRFTANLQSWYKTKNSTYTWEHNVVQRRLNNNCFFFCRPSLPSWSHSEEGTCVWRYEILISWTQTVLASKLLRHKHTPSWTYTKSLYQLNEALSLSLCQTLMSARSSRVCALTDAAWIRTAHSVVNAPRGSHWMRADAPASVRIPVYILFLFFLAAA